MSTLSIHEDVCSHICTSVTGQLTPTVNSPQKYVGQLTSVLKHALRSKQPIGGKDDGNNNSHASFLTKHIYET